MRVQHIFIFPIFLLLCTVSHAQETWLLELKNGQVLDVNLTKRKFASTSTNIQYINKSSGKKEKIKSDQLSTITSIIEGDTLVYKQMKQAEKVRKKLIYRKSLYWAAKIYETKNLEAYFTIESFGEPGSKTLVSSFLSVNLKIPSEDYIIFITKYSPNARSSSKVVSRYMMDIVKHNLADFCPKFSAGLNRDSYKSHEYKKLIDDYNAMCK